MPNRLIREALLHSERYHAINAEARAVFYELLLVSDDYALLPVSHVFLRMRCPTFNGKSPAQITSLLDQLVDQDLLRMYSVGSAQFGVIPRFGNWPKSLKPKWPLPPNTNAFAEVHELIGKASANVIVDKSGRKRISELGKNAGLARGSRGVGAGLVRGDCEPETETETETETERHSSEQGSPFSLRHPSNTGSRVKPDTATRCPPCPHAEIETAYHDELPTLRRIAKLDGTRKAALQARWRDAWDSEKFDQRGGIDFFRNYFRHVARSPFLVGNAKPSAGRDKPFRADFDFLMRASSFLSIIEGKYHDSSKEKN